MIYGLYYVEVGSFYAHFLKSFNHKWVLNLVKGFSASIEIIIWFLSFNLLIWCITLICVCWRILAFLEEIQLDHGAWAFWCIAELCLLKFCWGFLHLCSSVMLDYSFLFFVLFLSCFGIRVLGALKNEFGSVLSSAIFWKNFRKIGISSSLNVW